MNWNSSVFPPQISTAYLGLGVCFTFLPLFVLKGLYSNHRSKAPGCLFLKVLPKTPLPKTPLTWGNGCFTLHGAEQQVRTHPCSKVRSAPGPLQWALTTAVHFGTIVILIHGMWEFFTLLQAHRTQCFRKARAGFQPPPYLRVLLLWRQHWLSYSIQHTPTALVQPLNNPILRGCCLQTASGQVWKWALPFWTS